MDVLPSLPQGSCSSQKHQSPRDCEPLLPSQWNHFLFLVRICECPFLHQETKQGATESHLAFEETGSPCTQVVKPLLVTTVQGIRAAGAYAHTSPQSGGEGGYPVS